MQGRYNGIFDSFRGWAALGVVGMHCNSAIPFGWVGLLYFYVLSGYLVARSWLSVSRTTEGEKFGGALKKYLLRRVLRIFPLYYFYLGGLVLLAMVGWILPYFWGDLPSLLFGYYAWVPMGGMSRASLWYSHLWSISVELQFYLLLPFFFLVVPSHWRVRFLWTLVLVTPLLRIGVYLVMIPHGEWVAVASVYGAPTNFLDAFALGVLLAVAPPGEKTARKNFLIFSYGLIFFLVGFVLVFQPGVFWARSFGFPFLEARYFQWCWGYTLLHLFFYFLVGWMISTPGVSVVFDNRVTRYLGERSYGIYVYHAVPTALLIYFMGYIPSIWGSEIPFYIVLLAYGISAILAILSFRFIERPFLRMRSPVVRKGREG